MSPLTHSDNPWDLSGGLQHLLFFFQVIQLYAERVNSLQEEKNKDQLYEKERMNRY